jgi:hypothetical protein
LPSRGFRSAAYNPFADTDPAAVTFLDDMALIAHALIGAIGGRPSFIVHILSVQSARLRDDAGRNL